MPLIFIKRNDYIVGSVISTGYLNYLGYSLLFSEHSVLTYLPVIIWTEVNISFYDYPLRKEVTGPCLGIHFLPYCCNLADSDSVY